MVILMKKNGFTLTELIAIIVIIGILSLIVVPNVVSYIRNAQETSKEEILRNVKDAALDYAMENSKKSTFIPNNCAVDYIVTDDKPLNLPSGCSRVSVSVETLVSNNYYKDDAKKLKRDGTITIYKYKYTNNGKDFYDLKAYASENLLA